MNQPLTLIDRIDAVLPQTQCGKCGFSGCKPYAEAIVGGFADINQCPPGDQIGIEKIAQILGVPTKPLNTAHGLPKRHPVVALINEALCIGCTFCLRVCPVDAIVGAAKQLHTVVASECTGCELCIAPCPMDCIDLTPSTQQAIDDETKQHAADRARLRYQSRKQRLARHQQGNENTAHTWIEQQSCDEHDEQHAAQKRKQAIIAAALDRAASLRAAQKNQ